MSLQEGQQRLQAFNVAIRQLQEQAEARLPRLNAIIDQVAATGLVHDLVLLGGIVAQLPYAASANRSDSAQVLQAALVVPGGFGIAIFDSEEACRHLNAQPSSADIRARFVRFDDMLAAEKGLLLLHVSELLDRLCALVLPRSPTTASNSGDDHAFEDAT